MLSVLILLSAAVAGTPLPMQWAQFSRSPALRGVSETVDVATGNRTGNDFSYKLRLTIYARQGEPSVKWTDSAACPAARAVIASMTSIKMPTPAPYGVPGGSQFITVDGTQYFLTAPSSDNMGTMTISSNVGSPLAAWVDSSLKQLAPCWKMAAS